MKKIILFLFLFLMVQLGATAQVESSLRQPETAASTRMKNVSSSLAAPLGRPRSPLKNSFYSEFMWDFDGSQFGFGTRYVRRDYSLLGLGKRINPSGKTIVYDASVNKLTSVSDGGSMKFFSDAISFATEGKQYMIPLTRKSAPAGKQDLTPAEANLVTEYVNKAIRRTGATPSSVELSYNGNDFNITVYKSSLSGESFVVRGYNLGKRAENTTYLANIEAGLKSGDYESVHSLATDAATKYPDIARYNEIVDVVSPILEVKALNLANPESRIFRVVESADGFEVYDGMTPPRKYSTVEKDGFTKELTDMLSDEVGTLYFDVSGQGSAKAANFVKTMESQLSVKKPNLNVASAPGNVSTRNLLFNTNEFSAASKELTMESSSQAVKSYVATAPSGTTPFKVGIDFKPSVALNRVKKMARSFYGYLEGTLLGRSNSLNQSVIQAKKDLIMKYPDLTPKQFETFIQDELGGTNYVLLPENSTDGQIVATRE